MTLIKITENINPDEPKDSNKTEENVSISEHPAEPKNSNNDLPVSVEKTHGFSEKLEKIYIEIRAVKLLIKEYFFTVRNSGKNINVRKENRESMELLDLIRQQNCVLQEENASKNAIIKILVESKAASPDTRHL